MIVVWIPGALVNPLNVTGLGLWKHRRWARAQKARAEMFILVALAGRRVAPDRVKVITFVRYGHNYMDDDGLRAALKPTRDALKSMMIIDDDRPSAGHAFLYHQIVARGPRAPRGVEIRVAPR